MMLHDPSAQYLVTDAQRDLAVQHLGRSYGEGAIDEAELDRRLELALAAGTRAQLNQSLAGLARVRTASPTLPVVRRQGSLEPVGTPGENIAASLVHLSGFAGLFVVPAVAKAVSTPGSRIWWESSRALGLQLSTMVYGTLVFAAGLLLPLSGLWWTIFAAGCVAWFLLTIVGAVRALQGRSSLPALEPYMVVKPPRSVSQRG